MTVSLEDIGLALAAISTKLDQIIQQVKLGVAVDKAELIQGEIIMSELDDLQAAVTASDAGIASAVTLLNGLAAKLDAAIASGNPAALVALSTDIKAKTDALAAAVVADTRP